MPLSNRPGGLRAYKSVLRPSKRSTPDPRTHEGYEWLYVLDGRLMLSLFGPQGERMHVRARPKRGA